jgi:hypothetical protein
VDGKKMETLEGTKDRTDKEEQSDRGHTTHHETQSQMHYAQCTSLTFKLFT